MLDDMFGIMFRKLKGRKYTVKIPSYLCFLVIYFSFLQELMLLLRCEFFNKQIHTHADSHSPLKTTDRKHFVHFVDFAFYEMYLGDISISPNEDALVYHLHLF